MSEMVVIYKALPETITEIIRLLEEKNLHPEIIDDTGKTSSYRIGYIRIAVPTIECEMATKILAETEQAREKQIKPVIKTTNKIILIIIILLVIAAIVGFLDKSGVWFTFTWLLITVIAGYTLIKQAWANHSEKKK